MNIFVGSLPAQTPAEELITYFQQYEGIKNLKRKKNKGKKSPGYAILRVESLEIMNQILSKEHVFKGKKLLLKPYLSPEQRLSKEKFFQDRRIYLKNLPEFATVEILKGVFSTFGKIESIMTKRKGGTGRLYGFVTFEDNESALLCVNKKRFQLGSVFIEARPYKIKQGKFKDLNEKNFKFQQPDYIQFRENSLQFTKALPLNHKEDESTLFNTSFKLHLKGKQPSNQHQCPGHQYQIFSQNFNNRNFPNNVNLKNQQRVRRSQNFGKSNFSKNQKTLLKGAYPRSSFITITINGQKYEKLCLSSIVKKDSFYTKKRDFCNLRLNLSKRFLTSHNRSPRER